MQHPIDFAELAPLLKRLLKEKGITYRELAKRLKISESSVKKAFIAEDCSLSRLNQICGFLGIGLGDLLSGAASNGPGKFQFTAAQERFLTQNRRSFQVYWKLVYEGLSQEGVKQFFRLSDAQLFKILRGLDQHGLLELLPGGKLRLPDMSMLLWESSGPLVDMVRSEWAPLIVKRVGEQLGERREGYGLGLRFFELKPESAQDLKRALEELTADFGRRSVRERRLSAGEVRPVFLVSAFSPSCFVEEL